MTFSADEARLAIILPGARCECEIRPGRVRFRSELLCRLFSTKRFTIPNRQLSGREPKSEASPNAVSG